MLVQNITGAINEPTYLKNGGKFTVKLEKKKYKQQEKSTLTPECSINLKTS